MTTRFMGIMVVALASSCSPTSASRPVASVSAKASSCSTEPTPKWRELDLSVVTSEPRWRHAMKTAPCVDRKECPARATSCDCDEKGRFVRSTRDERSDAPGDDELRVRRWSADGCAWLEEIDWDLDGVIDARVRVRLDDAGRPIERLSAKRDRVHVRSIYLPRPGGHTLEHFEEATGVCSERLLDELGREVRSTSFLPDGRCAMVFVYDQPCADPSGPGCPGHAVECPADAHPEVAR